MAIKQVYESFTISGLHRMDCKVCGQAGTLKAENVSLGSGSRRDRLEVRLEEERNIGIPSWEADKEKLLFFYKMLEDTLKEKLRTQRLDCGPG